MTHPDAAILHYPYMSLKEMGEKAARSCPEFLDQVRAGNVSAAVPCFVIKIDREAFLAAVSGSGARVRNHYHRNIVASAPTGEKVAKQRWLVLDEPAAIIKSSMTRGLAAAGLLSASEIEAALTMSAPELQLITPKA